MVKTVKINSPYTLFFQTPILISSHVRPFHVKALNAVSVPRLEFNIIVSLSCFGFSAFQARRVTMVTIDRPGEDAAVWQTRLWGISGEMFTEFKLLQAISFLNEDRYFCLEETNLTTIFCEK